MSQHTPTPWEYVASTEHHGPYICGPHGGTIADLYLMSQPGALSVRNGGTSKPVPFYAEMADPNAALIVKAVNSHDALVKALRRLVKAVNFRDAVVTDQNPKHADIMLAVEGIDRAMASAVSVLQQADPAA